MPFQSPSDVQMEIWRPTSPEAFLLLAMVFVHISRGNSLITTEVSTTRSGCRCACALICGTGIVTTANLSSFSKSHLIVILESENLTKGELD